MCLRCRIANLSIANDCRLQCAFCFHEKRPQGPCWPRSEEVVVVQVMAVAEEDPVVCWLRNQPDVLGSLHHPSPEYTSWLMTTCGAPAGSVLSSSVPCVNVSS